MTTKTLSSQAQVAKLCRQYLKSIGVKGRARSESFSMGDSVTVYVSDIHPDVRKQIESEFSKYQYGHFDGMQDMYEYSNRRHDIPQTKYMSVNVEYSDEIKQRAYDYLKAKYANYSDFPESYADARYLQPMDNWSGDVQQEIYQLLNGSHSFEKDVAEFWNSLAPAKIERDRPLNLRNPEANVTIEEHTHTKRGFQMFIVILPNRVERAEYLALLDQAKSLGGWYSRKWGTTPAGFAFKERETAEQFAANLGNDTPPPKGNGDKFRKLAEKLQPTIENKLADRLTNTPKRLAQASSVRLEGERLQRTQQALFKLAELHDSGEVPPVLTGINSKSAVYDLVGTHKEHAPNGYHAIPVCTGTPSNTSPAAVALWALLEGKSEADKQADELRRMVEGLQFSNIPGYFPTPNAVIATMLDYADIQPDHVCLEPSAGSGAIADRVKPLCGQLDTVEANYTLSDILKAKGYPVTQGDFLLTEFTHGFDRILMNPPFEQLQDIDHIEHAYSMLNEGGRLVSVASASVTFNSRKKAASFRDWVDSKGGEIVQLPENAFKESGTGVNSVLVILDK